MDEKSPRKNKTNKIDKTVKIESNISGNLTTTEHRFTSNTKLTTFVKKVRREELGKTSTIILKVSIADTIIPGKNLIKNGS